MRMTKHNKAVVRDPGTVFVLWDATTVFPANADCLIVTRNLTTGEDITHSVNFRTGSHYIHSLEPDTYYHITLECYTDTTSAPKTIIDFGTVHTYPSGISQVADSNNEWATDSESLLRLTGELWQPAASSDRYNDAEK